MERITWTTGDLLQVSNAYWSSCAIHAGVKLDLFTPLAACPHSAADLADLVGADVRGLTMLLNALVALGLLDKVDEAFTDTPFSAEFLSRTSPGHLGYIIQHHHNLMTSWAHLDEAVRYGRPVRGRYPEGDEEYVRESFEMGMLNLATLSAPRIVPHIDLKGRSRLLDLGGGPGAYSVFFCRHNPDLSAVVYDLPTTRRFAEETVARYGLSDRITFAAGDYLVDRIPGRYDAAWLSQILHSEGPDECARILEKVAAVLEAGGRIFVQEFVLNGTMDGPLQPALFALNMLTGTAAGRAYSEEQLREMLFAAGFVNLRRLPLDLPNGAGILEGSLGKGEG
jgi:hypothetical protein